MATCETHNLEARGSNPLCATSLATINPMADCKLLVYFGTFTYPGVGQLGQPACFGNKSSVGSNPTIWTLALVNWYHSRT